MIAIPSKISSILRGLQFHSVVPTERLELSQGCPYTLLKRARLPVPPRRHITGIITNADADQQQHPPPFSSPSCMPMCSRSVSRMRSSSFWSFCGSTPKISLSAAWLICIFFCRSFFPFVVRWTRTVLRFSFSCLRATSLLLSSLLMMDVADGAVMRSASARCFIVIPPWAITMPRTCI